MEKENKMSKIDLRQTKSILEIIRDDIQKGMLVNNTGKRYYVLISEALIEIRKCEDELSTSKESPI